jgi:hypothetical protein
MGTNRIITIALALGVGGALLTSCGDDTETLSKPEFVEQADAICQTASDEIEPAFDAVWEGLEDLDMDDPANEGVIFVRYAEAASQVATVWNQMSADIRELAEPDEDHELIKTLFDDLNAAVDDFVETTAAAADGDQAAMQTMENDEDPFEDLNRRAREYGLTVCGEE